MCASWARPEDGVRGSDFKASHRRAENYLTEFPIVPYRFVNQVKFRLT
jgi:hypothetical protein